MKGHTMKETKLQRDIRLLTSQIARWEAVREASIATLVKAEIKLPELRSRRKRLTDRALSKLNSRPVSGLAEVKDAPAVPVAHVAEDRSKGDDPVAVQDKPGAVPGA